MPPAGEFHVGVVFAEPDAVIVRETTLDLRTTLGLGAIAMALLVVLVVTGVALMFWYVLSLFLSRD